MEKCSAEEVAQCRETWVERPDHPRGYVRCEQCKQLRLMGTPHECKWVKEQQP